MKNRVLFIVCITTVLLALTVYALIGKTEKEELLNKTRSINNNLSKEDPDYKGIVKGLDDTVADKKYELVEKAYNNYMLNITYKIEEIKTNVDTDKIYSLLDIKNIKEDGQEFKDTTKYISETTEKLKDYKKDLKKLTSTKIVMSYLPVEATNSEKELYKEMINNTNIDDKALLKSIEDAIKVIEKEEKVIIFLKENKDKWEIDKDSVAFTDDKLLKEYNKMLEDIK